MKQAAKASKASNRLAGCSVRRMKCGARMTWKLVPSERESTAGLQPGELAPIACACEVPEQRLRR